MRVERVAIERPDGLLVGRLLAAGITVIAIHPNQLAAARDRFRAAAGKSDRFDAFVLCELARTDRHRFAALAPSGDETLALRALVRTREDLVAARVALANQLRAQLDAFWPGATADLRRRRQPDRARVPGALPQPRRRPRPRPQAPARASSPATPTAAADPSSSCSSGCAPRPSPASANSKPTPAAPPSSASSPRCARSSNRSASSPARSPAPSARHPDGPIFLRFFRDPKSVICAAGLLAEIGDNRARYPTRDTPRRRRRPAPVAKRVRQTPRRQLPLGLRQTPAQPHRRPRRQHPPLAPLGPRRLPTRPRPRLRPPPRHPHPATGCPGKADGSGGRSSSSSSAVSCAALRR